MIGPFEPRGSPALSDAGEGCERVGESTARGALSGDSSDAREVSTGLPKPSDHSLRRASLQLLTGGLVGKSVGIVRELLLAAAYGTSSVTASFRIGQTATLIPVQLVTTDSLTSGFLPLHARESDRSPERAAFFYRSTQVAILLASAAVTVIVFVTAAYIVDGLAPGLTNAAKAMATRMVRVMVLGVPFYMSGALNSYLGISLGHRRLFSLRSTIQNTALVAGIGAAVVLRNPEYLAVGFTAGCVVYSAAGLLYVRSQHLLEPGPFWLGWRAMWRAIRPLLLVLRGLVALPLLIQGNEALERIVASTLGAATVAATEFANFIVDTSVLLLAIPLGFASLAAIGHEADSRTAIRRHLLTLTPLMLAVGLPLSLLLSVHANAYVGVLYARGHFNAASTSLTGLLTQGFAVGLWAQLLSYVYVKTYSGSLRVKQLVGVSAVGVVCASLVMLIAIPTHNAIFIGLAGSVYGVTVALLIAWQVGIVRNLLRWLVLLAPGCVIVCVVVTILPTRSILSLAGASCAALGGWVGYCLALPDLRGRIIHTVWPDRK
jgi:putative peptidoglycan lipid II flippase